MAHAGGRRQESKEGQGGALAFLHLCTPVTCAPSNAAA